MVIKTATYSGMNLKGEIRESISLDEDDISDVEDEVFIRDGKNGYKLAEELNVKRPLMAPRRRPCKYDSGRRLNKKANYRAWCKPCCYAIASFSILLGLIVLVVVLVSIYPLPLDKLREWITFKSQYSKRTDECLPCTNLNVTEVWSVNLPGLTSESPTRVLDIDGDGIKDILFGFGTGGNNNIFAPNIYCPIFLGIPPPCDGGLIALSGKTGKVVWKYWTNDTVFGLHCTADVNMDDINDCLYVGVDGTIALVDARKGKDIWKLNAGKMNVFLADFVPDQNGDNISDVIASYSSLKENASGRIILLSGKTGETIKKARTPHGTKTFYMPQILKQNGTSYELLFGTGTPGTPGNLSVIPLKDLEHLENKSVTLYEDKFKGMLTQSVLVDITGDQIPDIITSTYNGSVIAINGRSFKQIWRYDIAGAVTDMSATPANFNDDNITDFMVIYQKYDAIFKYNYTQTFIIDGLTGQPIYQPISGGIITQMNALTLSMEGNGHDIYVFWTSECYETDKPVTSHTFKASDQSKIFDECRKQFNSSTLIKLNALNAYHQPPGITLYNSVLHTDFEFNDAKSATRLLREYFKNYSTNTPYDPSSGSNIQLEPENPKGYNPQPGTIDTRPFVKSSFRHKDKPGGIIKDYGTRNENLNGDVINIASSQIDIPDEAKIPNSPNENYIWMSNPVDLDQEFSNYNMGDDNIPYNQKQLLIDEVGSKMMEKDRNLRSNKKAKSASTQSTKKDLSDKIYGYRNVRLSKDRLLNDEESLPTDILRDNYFKNEEKRLKKMKLEQRDVNSHMVGEMDDLDIKNIIETQKKDVMQNHSTTLWDIESENELGEREDKEILRRRRDTVSKVLWDSVSMVTSVGAVLNPFNVSTNIESNAIDLFFVKYWQPLEVPLEVLMARDIEDCIVDKKLQGKGKESENNEPGNYRMECQGEQDILKRNFPSFDQLVHLKQGVMTAYRIRIQCNCDSTYNKGIKKRCAKFLPDDLQAWTQYLGREGNGVFNS